MKTKFTLVMMLLAAFITNANAQWAVVTTNTTKGLNTVSFSGNKGVIGGDNGVLLYSDDAGLTWSDSAYWPWNSVRASAYPTPTTAVVGMDSKVFYSSNSGQTFTGPSSVTSFSYFKDMAFTSATNGYAVDDYCNVATTTDGGQNWTVGPHPCSGVPDMSDIDFPTASVGYLAGANGNVFKSIDAGATWLPVTAPDAADVSYFAIQFLDANTGFISGHGSAGQDTMVFKKTVDGGSSWIDMSAGIIAGGVSYADAIYSFSFANASVGYLVSDHKIYKTTDGGTTWALDYTAPSTSNVFRKITAFPNVVMALAGNGFAVRINGTGSTGISEVKNVKQIDVYPNPSSSTITLGSFLVQKDNLFAEITDVNGRIVLIQKLTTNELEITSLTSGIYFGTAHSADGTNYNFKFIKQ